MAKNWKVFKITGGESEKHSEDGESLSYTFPNNDTSDEIVYEVRVTDENGCKASQTIKVPKCDVTLNGTFTRVNVLCDEINGSGIQSISISYRFTNENGDIIHINVLSDSNYTLKIYLKEFSSIGGSEGDAYDAYLTNIILSNGQYASTSIGDSILVGSGFNFSTYLGELVAKIEDSAGNEIATSDIFEINCKESTPGGGEEDDKDHICSGGCVTYSITISYPPENNDIIRLTLHISKSNQSLDSGGGSSLNFILKDKFGNESAMHVWSNTSAYDGGFYDAHISSIYPGISGSDAKYYDYTVAYMGFGNLGAIEGIGGTVLENNTSGAPLSTIPDSSFCTAYVSNNGICYSTMISKYSCGGMGGILPAN